MKNEKQEGDFAVPTDRRVKLKKIEKKAKYLDLAKELKKLMNMKITVIPIIVGALDTRTRGLRNKGTSEDNRNCSIADIGQNTEKSAGDLRSLMVPSIAIHH